MLVILFVAWFLMILSAKKISEAQKNGTWTQKLCGLEYMEAETNRYKLSKVYESYSKRLIYTAIAMFMTLGLIGLIVFTGFGLETIISIIRIGRQDFDTEIAEVFGKKSYIVFILCIILTGFLIYTLVPLTNTWKDLIQERSYNEPTSIADAENTIKNKKNPILIQSTVIGGVLSAVLLYIVYTQYAVASKDITSLTLPNAPSPLIFGSILGVFVIGMGLAIGLTKSYTYLNAWFSKYTEEVKSINTDIDSLLSDDALKNQTADYLSDNIKRFNPKADMDIENAIQLNYKDEKYAYLLHMDGSEVEYLEKTTITPNYALAIIEELKVDINRFVDNLELRTKYNTSLDAALLKMFASISGRAIKTEITPALLQTTIETAFKVGGTIPSISISLNNSIRAMLEVLLGQEKPIKVSEIRTAIHNEIDANAVSTQGMSKQAMKTAVETNVLNVIFARIPAGTERDNTLVGPTSTDGRRASIINSFLSSFDHGLQGLTISQKLVPYLTDRVIAIIKEMDQTNTQQTNLRTKLSELRRFQLSKETNSFVNTVFIWSIILISIFAFGIFHYFYQISPSLVTMFTAGTILVLVFILTFYGWFMGQTMV